ncbi:uracil phosphoribosyltransferase [Phormidium yuhuli AB48]|uniref:Uracil phosphoribosyltransferase n=1 Tax=Phormidium yuhuli AB48 TaxID=2940671 RepID=A0ABY5AVM3_9CYAN|nr:uracil phosphoribosyltransferase [Phormidium yuhuli]USR92926.1 uracil phosphoribosyltransferase [Phormidium yuhuli AB48]
MTEKLKVYVPPHPLIQNWLTMAREASTPPVLFRTAMTELGRWLTYEAIRDWLPTQDVSVQSPLAPAQGRLIRSDIPLAIVPILRAGLALLPGMQDVLPAAAIYHLGMVRDETSLDPSCYLNKLPDQFPPDLHLMISEPMLATGGTLDQTLQLLTQRGLTPDRLRIISIIAAPPALQRLNDKYSGLVIYSATIDEGLDDRGFILPGLGDAGDRSFGT